MTSAVEEQLDSAQIANVLAEIARSLESEENRDTRVRRVLQLLDQLVPYQSCALLTSQSGSVHLLTVPETALAERAAVQASLSGILGAIEGSGETLLSGAVSNRLILPVIGADRIIGLLQVEGDHGYDLPHVQLLSTAASHLGTYFAMAGLANRERELRLKAEAAEVALQQSEAQLEKDLADSRLLQAISAQFIEQDRVEVLYEKIIDAAVAIMRSDFASMQMFYPERGNGGELRLLAFRGFNPEAAKFWEWVQVASGSPCGAALRTGMRAIVPDVEECEFMAGTEDLAICRQTGIRAIQTTPLFSRDGRIVGMISTHWRNPHEPTERDLRLLDIVARQAADLIERKRAEEELRAAMVNALAARRKAERVTTALRESEERFRTIVDTTPECVKLVAPDGTLLHMNSSGLAMVGADCAQVVIGKNVYDLVAPEDRDRFRAFNERICRGEKGSLEFDIIGLQGTRRHMEAQSAPFRMSDGAVVQLAVTRDITDRRKAQEELRLSEQRFIQLAETIPQLAWMANPDGSIFWYNQRWYNFTGTTPEQMQGWGWRQVHHPDHRQRVEEHWRGCLTAGEAWEDTFPLRGQKGEYRWFLSRALPIRDEQGHIVRWFGTNTDITDQRQAQEELRRANQDLEQFAYSASHDLREPIRNISVYSEMLKRRYGQALDGMGMEYLSFIATGAHRMEALVKDLLTYAQSAKLEGGPADKVDATTALEGALTSLLAAIEESTAQVTHDKLPSLRVHEVQLEQLFQNLIGNAIKYRKDDDPPRIQITARPDGGDWLFSVRDNGIGIAPEYKNLVFGIFKRLHTDGKYSGTGIGLAICQRIVERYGGRIWVDSEGPGKGSTFHFTLPAGAESASK